MTYVECPICKDVFDASDLHIKNWKNSSNSPSNKSPNIDNNITEALRNKRRRTKPSNIDTDMLLPILWKDGHRYAITIEDILTDSCDAKHEFEYLGIVRTDAITRNDVHWSKCNKCGLDKFKSTPPPRHEGNCR
jgi:hypothetical protein